MTASANAPERREQRFNFPLPLWMILAALAIGLVGRLDAPTLVASFNSGYGAALGEFALILIPSFVLAACLSHRSAGSAAGAATVASPFMAAGMICPDTSYAALAPVAGRRKLSVALAGYAGFKLLFPAGPLIVATGLGVDNPYLFVVGLILLGPVWLFSELWVRYRTRLRAVSFVEQGIATGSMVRALMPFGGMALLLVIGSVADLSAWSFLDFITQPKGALAVAATAALLDTEAHQRRECVHSAIRRTAPLLLVIGAASAFGAVLTTVVPIAELLPNRSGAGPLLLLVLFAIAMAFKLLQGSSMATFAAVAPVAAPLVHTASLSPTAAVFAICLGSFIAILPNDSFYWLVRSDALADRSDGQAIATLAAGAAGQAVVGLAALYALLVFGVV